MEQLYIKINQFLAIITTNKIIMATKQGFLDKEIQQLSKFKFKFKILIAKKNSEQKKTVKK